MISVFYTKIHLLIRLMNSEAERKTIHHKSLTEVKTQLSWIRSHVRPKSMWVWQDVELNSLWLGYMLGSNICGSDNMSNSIPLGSATHQAQILVGLTRLGLATCQAQMLVGLVRCQTKLLWARSLGLGYLSGLSVCGSGRIIDATPLGSATYQTQVLLDLEGCQT